MNNKCRSLLGTMTMIILLLLLVYCIIGVQSQKETGELFFPFGYRPVVILSGSMEETLATGSVVVVKETKHVATQDIVFFVTDDGVPVIHRCIEVLADGKLVTKGDANDDVDFDLVETNQIQGKVVYVMNWLAPIFTKKIMA